MDISNIKEVQEFKEFAVIENKETLVVTVKEKTMVPVTLILGTAMTYAIWTRDSGRPGFQITILAILLVVVAFWYSEKTINQWGRENIFRTGAMLLIALSFSLYEQRSIYYILELGLFAFTGYWFLSLMGNRMDNAEESTLLRDGLRSALKNPFRYSPLFFKSMSPELEKSDAKKKRLEILIGLLLVLPVAIIVTILLAESDRRFQFLMENLFQGMVWDTDLVVRIVVAGLFALYFFGLFFGAKQNITKEKRAECFEKMRKSKFMTRVSVLVILFVLSFIYLLYIGLQIDTLIKVLEGNSHWVLAIYAYARQGFYQLCQVAFINAGVLYFVTSFMGQDETEKIIVTMRYILCILTLMLTLIALIKMGLYIGQYGFTPKRLVTSWFMLTLAIGFIIVMFSYQKKIALGKCLVRLTLMMTIILSLINVDAFVVNYNLNAYLKGGVAGFDVAFLYEQSDAAIIPAIRAYKVIDDPQTKKALADYLTDQKINRFSVYRSDASNYNIESRIARSAIAHWHEN